MPSNRSAALLALLLAFGLPAPGQGTQTPTAESERPKVDWREKRLDPALKLLYRASKGETSLAPARAREVLDRINGPRAKSEGKGADPAVSPAAARIGLLVKFVGDPAELEAAGFRATGKAGEIYAGTIRPEDIPGVTELSGTREMQASQLLRAPVVVPSTLPLLSTCSPDGVSGGRRATLEASPPSQPADLGGSGVVIGYVDTGVDIFHQDFRKADGTTRIKFLLDLSDPGDPDGDGLLNGVGPYGGTLYTEAQINAALQSTGTVNEKDTTGHGTHGLSVAAGDDPAFPGLAPAADLVVVKATREDGSIGFWSDDIVSALAFVDAKAAELGRPWVANLSLGTVFGAHDGRSLEEQAVDALVGRGVPGKAIVIAAGNSSANRSTTYRHFSGTAYVGLDSTHAFVVPPYTPNPGRGNDRIVFDIWYEGRDEHQISVVTPSGQTVTAVWGNYADVQTPDGDVFIANMGGANPTNGDTEAIVLVDDWTAPAPGVGTWTIRIRGTEIDGGGSYHGWMTDDSAVGSASPYLSANADNRYLVAKPGGAWDAITVGSYAKHDAETRFRTTWTDVQGNSRADATAILEDISDFSSPGKTRDGRQKPDLAAPGERLLGAVSKDAYPGISPTSIYRYHPFPNAVALLTDATANHAFGLLQGTSFAAPVVTGLVARILSANPALDAIQIRNMLLNSAIADGYTGTVPNESWGYGKVDLTVGTAPLPNDLRIEADALPSGVKQKQYNFVLTASGGALPYDWFVSGGSLPPGLSLENGGFLTGKPTTAGSYPVTIQVMDGSSPARTATRSFTLLVANSAPLHVTSVAHPVGHLDKSYRDEVDAEGGTPPYGWTLVGGALPPGLNLSGSGSIVGTPTAGGTYPFTVQAQDAVGGTDRKSGKIKVTGAGGSDWSVLGKVVPTVKEIVVDPNDSQRVVAATTGIDAIFESTDGGDSWRPISINNGLNSTGTQLSADPITSEIWTIQRDGFVGTGFVRRSKWYSQFTGSWALVPATYEIMLPDALAISETGGVFSVGFYGESNYFFTSSNHQAWQKIGGATQICGGSLNYNNMHSNSIGLARPSSTVILARWGSSTSGGSDRTIVCGSLDGGATWSDITNGSVGRLDVQVSATNPADVIKAGPTYVERSIDAGRNWTTANLLPAGTSIQLRRSESNPTISVAGTDKGFYKSTDGGSTWARMPILGVNSAVTAVAIDPTDADIFYVASVDGVRRSTDGGSTWTNASSGLVRRVLGDVKVGVTSPTDVAIASAEGPYLSRTSGDAWTKSTPGMTTFVTRRLAISGANPDLYFAGTSDAVYRSTNRGVTWSRVDGGVATGYPVMALEADPSNASDVLFSLSGTRGTYRSTDGGATFTSADVGLPYGTPNDLSFARDPGHAGRAFIALTNDGLYRSEDRGATWTSFGLNTQTVRAVEPAPSDSGYVYAAGATQTYFLDPSVGSWQAATVGPANPILSLAVDPNSKLVAYAGADHPGTAGNTGGAYKTTDGGRSWTRLAGVLDQLDVVALAAHPTASGVVWAATDNGGVFRTDDGGATWNELSNYGTVADLTNVNVPDPSNAFLLFAGTEGYGVQASVDGGRSFVPRVTGLANLYIDAVAFDPATPSTMYAGSGAGLFKSTDSGNTWSATPITSGRVTDILTMNEGTVKRIWITVQGEGVAASSDGGATFTMSSTGLGSLDLTSLALENVGLVKRIWITARGGQGVAYSDDYGQSWRDASGNGLVDRDVNSLAIQTGTVKRIWITADSGVFFSEDEGLSWNELSTGLPGGIPATSVSVDPGSNEVLVSLFSDDGGGIYRGGSTTGVWKAFSGGLGELKVRKLTNDRGHTVGGTTVGTTFYAATAGDGVYSTELRTELASPAPSISTPWLRDAILREAYSATLAGQSGTAPYAWSVVEGSLPPGLDLDGATGSIGGTPVETGVSSFTVQVSDANNRTGVKSLTLRVVDPTELHVISCTPEVGVLGTSATVTIRGTGFDAAATASFGAGVSVSSLDRVSARELTAQLSIAPGATPGWRTVTVTNPGPLPVDLANGFKVDYPTPTVTGVSPAVGSRKETLDVTVTGTNLDAAATASFGAGVTVNGVNWVSASQLTVNVSVLAAADLGTRSVTITNPSGYSASATNAFTVRAAKPSITSVAPLQGNQGATLNLTVTGADFQSDAIASLGSGIATNSTTFNSATQLTANVTIGSGATLGLRPVAVTNPDGQTGSLTGGFRVMGPAPQIVTVSPALGTVGTVDLTVDVTGTGFQAGASVTFGTGVGVNAVQLLTANLLRATLAISSGATPGPRNVVVTNLDGQSATLAGGFAVRALAPVLTSCNPSWGGRGATATVQVAGNNFQSGATASFGVGVAVGSTIFVSASRLDATVTADPAAALGPRTVTVTNPDTQSSSLPGAFEVRVAPPVVVSVNPNAMGQGEAGTVVVKGSGFDPASGVSLGAGVTVSGITFVSSTQLSVSATVAKWADGGSRSATVTNPDAQLATKSGAFTVTVPSYCSTPTEYVWTDLSAGTNVGLVGDDAAASIPIGFTFSFYGSSYSGVTVSSNGYLAFGSQPGTEYENKPLPSATAPNALVAVFWDDLAVTAASQVKSLLLGSAPSRRLVVGWEGVSRVGTSGTGSFQAVLFEGTNRIELRYRDVIFGHPSYDRGKDASIGIEDPSGTAGVQIGYDTAMLDDGTAWALTNVNVEAERVRLSDGSIAWERGSCGPWNVVRGDLANIASTGGSISLGGVSCLTADETTGVVADPAEPGAGQTFFYLVQPDGRSFGESSDGWRRVPGAGGCP